MMSFIFKTPQEIIRDISIKSKKLRLKLNLSQKSLSNRSGVSYGTLKKFESESKISLESLLKIALSFGRIEDFEKIFEEREEYKSIDEIVKEEPKRKRGRI